MSLERTELIKKALLSIRRKLTLLSVRRKLGLLGAPIVAARGIELRVAGSSLTKGGPGSGNFGHGGRPGHVGGSGTSGSGTSGSGTSGSGTSGSGTSGSGTSGSGTSGSGTSGSGSGTAVTHEPTTAPPPGRYYRPSVSRDSNGDGVTENARVGVGAFDVPPPPALRPLPNLNKRERAIESAFHSKFNKDPDKMTNDFMSVLKATTKPGDPLTFGTDDVKVLCNVWSHSNLRPEIRARNRAIYNTPLHQVANAVAKRAFVSHLDTLSPGDEIMVTVGGCGAGKGYALKNVPDALAMKSRSKAVWDSAGDQNATESPWILKEAQARGLKVNYVYVHADPRSQWAHPERGVVKRAADPNDGRMVDAMVFADSYAVGARNHSAFYEANKSNPSASFIFLQNKGKPEKLDGIPKDALSIDRKELARFAISEVMKSNAPPHVKRGATIGTRIWKGEHE